MAYCDLWWTWSDIGVWVPTHEEIVESQDKGQPEDSEDEFGLEEDLTKVQLSIKESGGREGVAYYW